MKSASLRAASVRANSNAARVAIVVATVAFAVASMPMPATDGVWAQEWSRFRGPNGQGQSESVFPAKFNPTNIKWSVALPGEGNSSPSLWGDKLFVLASNRETALRHVVCLDASSGATVWTRKFRSVSHKLHSRSSYASSTPAVDKDHVYVAWSTHRSTTLKAMDHAGTEVWTIDLGRWVGSHGFGTSPMLYKDLVILHNSLQVEQLEGGDKPGDSYMLAVDRKTGKEVWRSARPGARVCYSVPAIYQPAGGADELICCSTLEGIYSLNPANGEVNWSTAGAIKMRSVSSPIIAGGLILGSTGSGGGGNYVVAVRPGSPPEVAYQIKSNAPYVPTPVAHDGLLLMFDDKGIASCADIQTGEVHWRERLSSGFSGSAIRAGDKVYCISDIGELFCVAPTKQFNLLGKTDLGEASRSTPAVHKGHMYLRTQGKMICVEQPAS
jgi:outer membrane protein assembly factor BamB